MSTGYAQSARPYSTAKVYRHQCHGVVYASAWNIMKVSRPPLSAPTKTPEATTIHAPGRYARPASVFVIAFAPIT